MERALLQTAIGLRNWDASKPSNAPIQLGGDTKVIFADQSTQGRPNAPALTIARP